jgi:GNAT superfamily N-acetyltransferase
MCRDWVAQNLGKHVEGYHLQLPTGEVVGHLYYAPIERAIFPYEVESGVAVLYCDWVQRRYQGKGFGRLLFKTFVDDMERHGFKGILVETTDQEGQRHYRHYSGRGFETVLEQGHLRLLYLPISQKQINFQVLEPRIRPRQGIPVEIVVINGYLCPFDAATHLMLKQVVQEFGNQVNLEDVWLTPETLKDFGAARGIFINGRRKLFGGEPEESIRQAIAEELV